MITKQQQLGWLANNLEKWKSGYDYAVVEKTTDGHLYVRWPSVCTSGITKKEWQQERDKMQKQDNKSECAVMTLSEAIDHANEKSRELKGHCAANHSLLAQWLTEYRGILSKLNQQNEQDSSWHERGELPPVGCECEWIDESGVDGVDGVVYPQLGDVVTIHAHADTPGGYTIAIFTWARGSGLGVAASRMPEDFRPIRTEREKAIDRMKEIAGVDSGYWNSTLKAFAEALYDDGYRKVGSRPSPI